MTIKNRKEWARQLAAEGKNTVQISQITGLTQRTVNNYVAGYRKEKSVKTNADTVVDYDWQLRWTEAVNKLRRAAHKEQFPMPFPRKE